jgi:hypothetical protein
VAVNILFHDALLPFSISTRRKLYRTRTRAETEIGNDIIRFQFHDFRAANLYGATLSTTRGDLHTVAMLAGGALPSYPAYDSTSH